LVSTGSGLALWWAADVTGKAPGGTVELGFFNHGTVYSLELLQSSEGEVVWMCQSGREWKGTKLVFQLTPGSKGTIAKFTHAGWQAETGYFTSCNITWGKLMFRLKAAEGKSPGSLFSANGMAY
jgi:hypothetical protein